MHLMLALAFFIRCVLSGCTRRWQRLNVKAIKRSTKPFFIVFCVRILAIKMNWECCQMAFFHSQSRANLHKILLLIPFLVVIQFLTLFFALTLTSANICRKDFWNRVRDEITNSPPAANETEILWMLLNLFFRYLLRISAQFFFFYWNLQKCPSLAKLFLFWPYIQNKIKICYKQTEKSSRHPFRHQCRLYRSLEKFSHWDFKREMCNMPNRLKCMFAPANSFKILMSKLTKIKFKLAGWMEMGMKCK